MGTKIREKFIEHMEFFGLAKQTQRGYIRGLVKHHIGLGLPHQSSD